MCVINHAREEGSMIYDMGVIIRPFGLLCSRWFAHLIWPWEGSNYPSRSCNGPNGPKGPKFEQNKTKKHGSQMMDATLPPILPFVLPTRHSPHPPTPYVIRAWWTSSTGTQATSSCPPKSWRPPPAGGCFHPGRGLGFARATSISARDFCHPPPPYPISHSSAMV